VGLAPRDAAERLRKAAEEGIYSVLGRGYERLPAARA
jgi:hypothetical protein